MELSSSNIEKILIFSQKKDFLIFSQKKAFLILLKTGTLHFSAQACKPKNPPRENLLYFRKRKLRKKFLYSLYFRKWNF